MLHASPLGAFLTSSLYPRHQVFGVDLIINNAHSFPTICCTKKERHHATVHLAPTPKSHCKGRVDENFDSYHNCPFIVRCGLRAASLTAVFGRSTRCPGI